MAANFVLPITKLSVTKESGIRFMGCLRGMKKSQETRKQTNNLRTVNNYFKGTFLKSLLNQKNFFSPL